MKKLLFIMAMMLPLFTFIGCSDDDEKKIPDEMKNIYGTWLLNQVDTGNGDGYVDWPMEETSATFNEDGTYSGSGYFGNGSGTYKLEGSTITCFVGGKEFVKYDIISLTENNCELRMYISGSDTDLKIKCRKR